MELPLLKLAQVATADFGFVGDIVLRQPFRIAKAAQICGKDVSQVHARMEAACSVSGPIGALRGTA